LEEVKVMDFGERLLGTFRLQAAFCVRSCDNVKAAAQRCFDLLVKVVGMIVGEQNCINPRKFMEVDSWVRDPLTCHTRPKVNREALEREVDLVNEDRDFGSFLKRMRKLFVETMN